jgi:hypothetical protein
MSVLSLEYQTKGCSSTDIGKRDVEAARNSERLVHRSIVFVVEWPIHASRVRCTQPFVFVHSNSTTAYTGLDGHGNCITFVSYLVHDDSQDNVE